MKNPVARRLIFDEIEGDKMSENSPTFRLFSIPSSIEGVGSIADMAGCDFYYNSNHSAEEADFLALLSDWKSIGMDLSKSIKNFSKSANYIER